MKALAGLDGEFDAPAGCKIDNAPGKTILQAWEKTWPFMP
jgi:hypothetical protein